jgi:uncharacterized RDD family membrane protein YckC
MSENSSVASARRYFVAPHNTKIGPLSEDALVAKIRTGEYAPETMGWREGTAAWAPLRELFPQCFNGAAVAAHPKLAEAPDRKPTAVLGERTLGLIVDGFFLSILNGVALALDFIPVLPHIVVTVLYAAFTMGSSMQATPGMMICKLRIITEDGRPVDFKTAFARAAMAIVSGTFLLTVGYWWAFWDERNQTLHDKVAGTFVIRR